jgi:uncharacterized membrane-anchored protein
MTTTVSETVRSEAEDTSADDRRSFLTTALLVLGYLAVCSGVLALVASAA